MKFFIFFFILKKIIHEICLEWWRQNSKRNRMNSFTKNYIQENVKFPQEWFYLPQIGIPVQWSVYHRVFCPREHPRCRLTDVHELNPIQPFHPDLRTSSSRQNEQLFGEKYQISINNFIHMISDEYRMVHWMRLQGTKMTQCSIIIVQLWRIS